MPRRTTPLHPHIIIAILLGLLFAVSMLPMSVEPTRKNRAKFASLEMPATKVFKGKNFRILGSAGNHRPPAWPILSPAEYCTVSE